MENIEKLNLMEIYYGISNNNMPLIHQSIHENIQVDTIASVNNLRDTFLGAGALKSTVIRPELFDNEEIKHKKREYFESQIMNIFGKAMVNKGMEEIAEKDEDINDDILKGLPITKSRKKEE